MKKILKVFQFLITAAPFQILPLLVSRPLLFLPTVWATTESIILAQKYFGNSHHSDGIGNAFRHSLWNLLLSKYAAIFVSKTKAIDWAKKTTDKHEELFPNPPFDRMMDLHNNALGRKIFAEEDQRSKKELIRMLMLKTQTAVGLEDETQFGDFCNEMVYRKK